MAARETGATLESIDPGNGRVLARVAAAEATDVDDAIGAAQRAFRQSLGHVRHMVVE